jgi:hypothetical protein
MALDAGTQFTNLLGGKNKAINNFMLGKGQVTNSYSTMDPMAEQAFNANMMDMLPKVAGQAKRLDQGSREGVSAFDALDVNQFGRDVLSPMDRRYRQSNNLMQNFTMMDNGKQLHTGAMGDIAADNRTLSNMSLNMTRTAQEDKDRQASMAAEEQKQGRMLQDSQALRGLANATYEMPAPDIMVQKPPSLQEALKGIGYAAAMVMPSSWRNPNKNNSQAKVGQTETIESPDNQSMFGRWGDSISSGVSDAAGSIWDNVSGFFGGDSGGGAMEDWSSAMDDESFF